MRNIVTINSVRPLRHDHANIRRVLRASNFHRRAYIVLQRGRRELARIADHARTVEAESSFGIAERLWNGSDDDFVERVYRAERSTSAVLTERQPHPPCGAVGS